MKKVLVVGSLNMDQVTKVKRTPLVGETVLGQGLACIPGGKGANQAVAMAKLGADVKMMGMVGDDAFGQALKDNLKREGVLDCVGITDQAPTGTALIMVNESADNSIVVIPGANACLEKEQDTEGWLKGIDMVVLQLEIPLETVYRVLEEAHRQSVYTILNPSPAQAIDPQMLEWVDLLVVNETEFKSLTGMAFESEASLKIGKEKLGVGALLVTLGTKGAWYVNDQMTHFVPAIQVAAVDTTAAGDSFMGGLVCELSKGKSIEAAMAFATKVAAFTVTRFGAQSALPRLEDLA